MTLRGFITIAAALLLATSAGAQTSPGTSPLSVPKGGSGLATLTQWGVVYGNGTAPAGVTPAGTSGQLFIGQTSAAPAWKTVTGDVTINQNGVTVIGTAKVVLSMLADGSGLGVLCRSANTAGVPAWCVAANDNEVFRRSGAAIGFGTIATGGIADDAVTNAKLRNSGALSLMGRAANTTGDPADISAVAGSSCVFRENANTIDCGQLLTAGLANNAVTNAKIRQGIARSVIGVTGNASANPDDIQGATDQVLRVNGAGTALGFGAIDLSKAAAATGVLQGTSMPALSGDISNSAGSTVTAIGAKKVLDAMFRDSGALSVMGRAANSGGTPADISAAPGSGCVFRENGNTIACGTLATAAYAANSVTNAKLDQMAQARVKGRASGAGTGDPVDLTPAQLTAIVDVMVGDSGSGGTKGLCPAPGAGDAAAGKFCKADGTWAVPAGGGGGGGTTDAERQNSLIDRINISKALGDATRHVNLWASGFKASDDTKRGINTIASANVDVSAAVASGYVAPTVTAGVNQLSGKTATTAGTVFSGAATNTNDGNTSTGIQWNIARNVAVGSAAIIKVDLGAAVSIASTRIFGETTIRMIASWKLQYSNDGVSYTDAVVIDTSSSASAWAPLANFGPISARYWQWIPNANGPDGNTFGFMELELNTAGITNPMTLVTAPQTADSTISNGRLLVQFDNSAAPTLNTDLVGKVSCKLNATTVTISNASPGVISQTSHGLSVNDPVYLTTSGTLPTGLSPSVGYFVKTVPNANSYTLSATPGGSAINTSSAGSGTHTANYFRWANASLSAPTSYSGVSSSNRKVAESVDQACVESGTTFVGRIDTLNSKMIPTHGLSVTVH
ncbi:hypothetical protein RPMA_18285 [Tardiphaga alba]|uniref:F5/8 type C domain-containing protein n=1 Tax=Tardiphaga alba TaxID=340268 RepID=A0ABX8ABG3_9BRAD|nr:discoidin domain-containing protein [Tardiphaga alba]QUS40567.1 hypothetical protein RPMA_18285 [Tardiphaga alba]